MEGRAIARFVAAPGRERELDTLSAAWERARQTGRPSFARVHGPAGIGKSHLLHALARRLGGSGALVIEAGSDRSGGAALGLVAELARGLLAATSARAPEHELASVAARLAPLLDGPIPIHRRPEDLRLDIAEALADLLRIALPAAPVLLLDDVDAAEAGSLELLHYLGALLLQPGITHGCLVVLSYRDGQLPAGLVGLLERVPGLHLPLAPLDAAGVRSFLSRADVAERLFEATSGDPARLEAVLSGAPSDLGSRRLARLEPEAQQLLLTAAVLGEGASTALLCRVAGVADGPRLLGRLVEEGFLRLRVTGAGPGYGFAREADRETVLAAVPPDRLARCHLEAGDVLAAAGGAIEAIARHHLAGDPRGKGARSAFEAARQLAARCAYDTAIEFFLAALEGDDVDRRSIHLGLAAAYEAGGDMLAALRHLGLARRGAAPAQRRESWSEAARLCIRIGKLAQAERLCRLVLGGRQAFDPTDAAAARAWADYAEIRFLRSDYDGAMAAAEAGIARADGMPALRIAMRNTLGKALLTRGRYDDAAAAFGRNIEEADAAALQRERMLARINEGVVWHRNGDRERAIGFYRAGLAIGDDRSLVALALGNLAVLYHEVGNFEQALEHYGSALAAFTLVRRGEGVAYQGINRARLLLFLGDDAAALEGVEHARREAGRLGNLYLIAQAHLVRGEIALQKGDAQAALPDLRSARSSLEDLGNPRYVAEADIALVRALLAAGDTAAASAALPALEARAAAIARADLDVETALVAAEVELSAGRPADALPRLEAARAALLAAPQGVGGETDLEAPWRVYDLQARCHEALGQRAAADADRVRARAILEELRGRVPAAWQAMFARTPKRAALLVPDESEIDSGRAARVRQVAAEGIATDRIVGSSVALQRVLRRVGPVGRSLVPVLVRGESGVGKELVAEAIHAASARAALPLVKVICTAAQADLFAEIFGGEAPGQLHGRLEQARGGAIFLDEVAALSMQAQVALLRVLEEKSIRRPGAEEPIAVDVRVIGGTSRDLEAEVAAGRFREDLFYRLKGVMLELPPLRERTDDIPALVAHFLERLREERGGGPSSFAPDALALLSDWDWPGNVRELENLVAAVALFAEGDVVGLDAFEVHGDFLEAVRGVGRPVQPAAAPAGEVDFYALAQARGIGVRELRHEVEMQMIGRALLEAKGNISEAARLLQMKRSRLSQIVNGEPELLVLARTAGETDADDSCIIDPAVGGV